MRIKGTVVLFLALICLPLPLYAVDMNGASRTYFQARESFDDETYLPLFEYLDFSLDDFAKEEYSFHFGGWARRDLNNEKSFDQRSSNLDLQYAYLNLHRDEANAVVNVGRVPVYEGVASESVDGFYTRSDLLHGFGIAAYGGIPVETDFDKRGGDLIYGTRISREQADLYRVGLSYLKERNDGEDFRSETGLDLRLRPHEQVELFGRSTFNGETSGWMEHAYSVTYLPREDLRIVGELDAVNYEDYFANVDTDTTGIFDLSIGVLDPNEELLELGLRGEYKVKEELTATALFRNYNYSEADSSNYYGAGLTYQPTEEMGGGCSLYRMDGQSDARRYYELRLYAYKQYDKADVTVDLFNVHYDESINGESNGFSASAACGYALSENGRLSADVEYASNPTFSTDIRLFVKYLYNFNVSPLKVPEFKTPKLSLPQWKVPFFGMRGGKTAATAAVVTAEATKTVSPETAPSPAALASSVVPEPAPAEIPQPKKEIPQDPDTLRMENWRRELLNSTPEKYTIQVEISEHRDRILEDLKGLPDHDAMVVPYTVRGWNAYTLVIGIYDSREAAKKVLRGLPESIRKLGPLVRSIGTIQKGL